LDQESRTDRTADPAVAQALTAHVERIIPQIEAEADYVGEYVGIRPGSNHRDYQIHLIPSKHWIAAAGIRSTGLTASLGIGRHVVHLLQAILPSDEKAGEIVKAPLPDLAMLVREFHSRQDGKVTIHGHEYLVTHPLTRLGWEAKTGLASM
jgi:glycerol-3-phosphate dehydrogenase